MIPKPVVSKVQSRARELGTKNDPGNLELFLKDLADGIESYSNAEVDYALVILTVEDGQPVYTSQFAIKKADVVAK